ncbi:hypothetical protein GCM10010207_80300 [Streptomyces atratus]|nr:hypothetical protein GCM10010207_80300 [Streptomyces atratus]
MSSGPPRSPRAAGLSATQNANPTKWPDKTCHGKAGQPLGNAELPLTKEIGAGTLAIQINCQGKKILNVTVAPVGLSFPLNCVNEEVSSTYNEIHLKRARSEGTVQVSAPSTVRWALTVEQ